MLFSGKSRQILSRFIGLAVSALILTLIFRRIDLGELWRVLQDIRLGWFLIAIVLFGLIMATAAWRWHLMLGAVNAKVHPAATYRTVLIGHFFNTVLFGPATGDLAKSALYGRWYGHPIPHVLAGSFLDRIVGGGGHILFILLAIFLATLTTTGSFEIAGLFSFSASHLWTASGILLALAALGAMAGRRLKSFSPLVKMLEAFRQGVKQLILMPRLALKAMAVSFLMQLVFCSLLAFCLQAVSHKPLPWLNLLWTFPVISLVSGVPLAFAGAGVRDAAALILLGLYGITETDAVAASLLTLAIIVIWALIGGALLWRQERLHRRHENRSMPETISLVIPAWNEAATLPKTVELARQAPEIKEILVVDGGSLDDTVQVAEKLGCKVILSRKGRGLQLRSGAAQATGDVIVLLHADTWLPPGSGQAILNCLRDAAVVGGGFWKVFDHPTPIMFGSRLRCATRLFIGRRIAGDQAMFIRREVLEEIGGVPDMPLMEEFELCRRLRKAGSLALAGGTVITSTRRFAKLGVLRTYLRMWRVTLLYYFGTPAQKLQRLYERD